MAKTIPKSCRHRHHSYPSDDPGAECLGCGKKRGAYSPRALGAAGVGGLRAALGITDSQGAGPPQEKQQPPPAPETASSAPAVAPLLDQAEPRDLDRPRRPPSSVLWPKVAHRLTQAFDSVTDTVIEKTGRVPNSAEPEDLAEFEGALAEQLGIWFPDVAAGPKARMGMAAFFIVMGKRWNAEKIAPPKPTMVIPTPTPTTPPPQPPAPPAQPPNGHHFDAPVVATTAAEATLLHDLES